MTSPTRAGAGTRAAPQPSEPASRVLLRRRGSVYLPPAAASARGASGAGVDLLEADLVDRGYLLSADLRDALLTLADVDLAVAGAGLLADVDAALGADAPHVPLFRHFPRSVPADTAAYFVERLLTVLFQHQDQPCVLCGRVGVVHPVSPCAHLVCRACFDGADFSACPVCHRRIDLDDPFLVPSAPPPARRFRRAGPDAPRPVRLRVLTAGGAVEKDARADVAALLARPSALGAGDLADLLALLEACPRDDLAWLPERIPGRETKAYALAWLLADTAVRDVTLPAVAERLDTPTDLLRLLAVLSGGDAGLVDIPLLPAVPRPLRRVLLAALDRLDPGSAVEDMLRYRRLWVGVAERLHPFEHVAAYPRAAAAFAVLRGTDLEGTVLGTRIAATGVFSLQEGKLTHRGFRSRVEACLTECRVTDAVLELRGRPGELLRRLDHLLRLGAADPAATGAVLEALPHAAGRVSPAVLLSALGEVRTRDRARAGRVFFPKGASARIYLAEDTRVLLEPAVVAGVVRVLTAEATARAARLPAVATAVVDAGLDDLAAPFTARTASRSLVSVPRGSLLPMPAGRRVRLFLHWMEDADGPRVDLDLSVAMFDAGWEHVGTCDYTHLRYGDSAAVHSGDLTSAPPPLGATEFVDLDLAALADGPVRHLVVVVFSYNNVAFEDMAAAFAGFMTLPGDGSGGPVFRPGDVEQRLDLAGQARALVLGHVDLTARALRWLDVTPGVTGTHHAVHRHRDELAALGSALEDLFASGARVGLGEVARWHAAARARSVIVRGTAGELRQFRRGDGEDAPAFAARIATGASDGPASLTDAAGAALQFVVRGDLVAPDGAEVHALDPALLDPDRVDLRAPADTVAALAPVI